MPGNGLVLQNGGQGWVGKGLSLALALVEGLAIARAWGSIGSEGLRLS